MLKLCLRKRQARVLEQEACTRIPQRHPRRVLQLAQWIVTLSSFDLRAGRIFSLSVGRGKICRRVLASKAGHLQLLHTLH